METCDNCQSSCDESVDALVKKILILHKTGQICTDCLLGKISSVKDDNGNNFKRLESLHDQKQNISKTVAASNIKLENTTEKCFLTHAVSHKQFYLQRKCDETGTNNLRNQLNRLGNCPDVPSFTINPKVGEYVLAKYSVDQEWYRCIVKKSADEGTALLVQFIDFGNSEYVLKSNLKSCPEAVKNIPKFAIECSLVNVEPGEGIFEKDIQKLSLALFSALDESPLMVTFESVKDDGCANVRVMVSLAQSSSFYIRDIFASLGCLSCNDISELVTDNFVKRRFNKTVFALDKEMKVDLISVMSPDHFVVQSYAYQDRKQIKMFQNDLHQYYKKNYKDHIIGPVFEGMPVVVKDPKGNYCRGEILKIRSESGKNLEQRIVVDFVDQGFESSVNWCNIFNIKDELIHLMPITIISCCLDQHNLGPENCNMTYTMKINKFIKKVAFVELCNNDRLENRLINDFAEKSIQPQTSNRLSRASQLKASMDEKFFSEYSEEREYYVVHVVSPSEIYLQPAFPKLTKSYEKLRSDLRKDWSTLERSGRDSIKVGNIHAIGLEGDYYRCRIMKMSQKEIEVKLIDNGKTVIIEENDQVDLKDLPDKFLVSPAFCLCVEISNVPWNGNAVGELKSLLKNSYKAVIDVKDLQDVDGERAKVVLKIKDFSEVDAFEPARNIYKDVIDILRRKIGPLTKESKKTKQAKEIGTLIDWSVPDVSRLVCFPGEGKTWLPPIPFSKNESPVLEWKVCIRHIDFCGQIYVQTENHLKQVNRISRSIAFVVRYMQNLESHRARNTWKIGSIGVARGSDYPNWGRIVVSDVTQTSIRAFFVDFGFEKNFKIGDVQHILPIITKSVQKIPIQMWRCKLKGIVPTNGTYSNSILEKLNRFMVDQDATIFIPSDASEREFPYPVEIRITNRNDEDFATYLVTKRLAKWWSGSEEKNDLGIQQEEIALYIQPEQDSYVVDEL